MMSRLTITQTLFTGSLPPTFSITVASTSRIQINAVVSGTVTPMGHWLYVVNGTNAMTITLMLPLVAGDVVTAQVVVSGNAITGLVGAMELAGPLTAT